MIADEQFTIMSLKYEKIQTNYNLLVLFYRGIMFKYFFVVFIVASG